MQSIYPPVIDFDAVHGLNVKVKPTQLQCQQVRQFLELKTLFVCVLVVMFMCVCVC